MFDKVFNSSFSCRLIAITLLLGLTFNFAGASQAQAAPKTYSLTIKINSGFMEEIEPIGQTCDTLGKDSNYLKETIGIALNDRVTIKNSNGKRVAVGKMKMTGTGTGWCSLTTKITKIPKSDFYDIQIGTTQVMEYFFEDLVEKKWLLSFII